MEETVLETRHLTKQFKDVVAVDQVGLNVVRGEVFGFLGPNGAGKTTTIGMVLGLLHPTAGEVRVFGERVDPGHVAPLRRVGALVGAPAMVPTFTARQNLMVLSALNPGEGDRARRVAAVLERVGLAHAADRKVKGFSLGMKQRLGLGAALLHEPHLLILDEPTNGLDPAGMIEIRDLLRELAAAGVTVFLSSHLLHEVEQVCDRVAVLHHGRVVAQGAVAALLGGEAVVRARVDDPRAAAQALRDLGGVTAVRPNGHYVEVEGADSRAVNLHLVQRGVVPSELTTHQNDLEDVFLALTG
jgi:ABC-2 type transport system ATP-binding protein